MFQHQLIIKYFRNDSFRDYNSDLNFSNENNNIKNDDLEMTDIITKRQHYIPQFYLKQFATIRKNEYYICCYNKINGNIFKSNVKNIGLENWFYDKKFKGENVFEKALSILEGYFSKIYKIMREKPISLLTYKEKQFFVEFVYLLDTRTRKARDGLIKVNENIINSESFQNWFQKTFPNITIEEHLEDIKRYIQLSEMFNIEIKDNKPQFSEAIDRIMEFDLFLLINDIHKTGANFYTSDHPICHYSLSEEKDMKIIIPMTPELCLMFTNDSGWKKKHPSHKAFINKKFIQVTNERTVEKAYRFVFSKTNDFEFVRRVLNQKDK